MPTDTILIGYFNLDYPVEVMQLTWKDRFKPRDLRDDVSGWILSGPHKTSKIDQISKNERMGQYFSKGLYVGII